MKSADSSTSSFTKSIGLHVITMLDASGTGICSIAAFVCLIVLDGWLLGGWLFSSDLLHHLPFGRAKSEGKVSVPRIPSSLSRKAQPQWCLSRLYLMGQ